MPIEWPLFPPEGGALDQPATEDDVAAGRAAFVLRDASGRLVGSPVPMGLPRLGFYTDTEQEVRRPGVAIQVEAAGEQIIVGVLHADNTVSICSPKEFESAPRFLILYRKPEHGLDEVEKLLKDARFQVDRQGDALAVRQQGSPLFFVRHAGGEVAGQEIALLRKGKGRPKGLASCDGVVEVSFLDLDEVLDETNTLIELQATFEALEGYLYLGWNDHLSKVGE